MKLGKSFAVFLAGALIALTGVAWAADTLTVQAPWKIEGKLPDPRTGAQLNCALIDKQCNVAGGQSIPVGIKAGAGGPTSGSESFTFSGPQAKDAVGVECEISAPGMTAGADSKNTRPIPGRFATCMVQENGKWKALDLVEMQKRGSAWAKARAAKMEADRKAWQAAKAAEEAADRKGQEDFAKMRAATKAARDAEMIDRARRLAVANAQMKGILDGIAKAKADKAIRKKFTDLRGEKAFYCSDNPNPNDKMGVEAKRYCNSRAKTFSLKAKCVNGECLESDRTLDAKDSPCQYNVDCDNRSFEGLCKQVDCQDPRYKSNPSCQGGVKSTSLCVTRKRERCETPGEIFSCFPMGSQFAGTAVCNSDGVIGTCTNRYEDHKASKDKLNDPDSAWTQSKPSTVGPGTIDANGSPCKTQQDCNNVRYHGQCVKGTCVTHHKRASCSVNGQTKLCFSTDGRKTAGVAVCAKSKPYDGVYKDCVSRQVYHKDYLGVADKYSKAKSDWDKMLSKAKYVNSDGDLNLEGSPCSTNRECSGRGYTSFCDLKRPLGGKAGQCSKAAARQECITEGLVRTCVHPLNSEFGVQRCTKFQGNVTSALQWGDCFSTKEVESKVSDLKRTGKL